MDVERSICARLFVVWTHRRDRASMFKVSEFCVHRRSVTIEILVEDAGHV